MAKRQKLKCPKCNGEMNRHAEKLDLARAVEEPDSVDTDFGAVLEEFHTCPACKYVEERVAES